MPSKDSNSLDRQREIFVAALSVSRNRQAAFLEEACQGDPALRTAVADLLAHHLEDDFLAEPAVDRAQDQEAEAKGGWIGPYRLREEIGRGGMGVVFRAEQEVPVKRQVALKVIRAGMDSEEVIKRFAMERQVLAAMDHPHIARILDAGTTPSHRPYFVMELVEGVKVTTFCQRHQLTTCQRLQLFVDICAAVQHAHQKGIIHRDLKPGNVLVTMCDGAPIPKVIDFGIAKAIGEEWTEQTALTRFGPFMGTMAYMSPEQAGAIPAGVDTRTDIYALGVLLYEMLTGVTPFETGSTSGPEAFLRMIREEDPPKPSTRLTQLQKLAAKDAHYPERKFAGDIDWIVLKALEKDPQRRYETVNAMALDVKRYLNDEPVLAIAPSLCYRFGKFIRRHRAVTLGSAAVLASLVIGLVLSLLANVREQKASEFAEDQRYASDMKVALMASLSHDRTELVSLLEKHRPAQHAKDRRGWLWHCLESQCHQELRGTNVGRASLALATSPDGRWIAHAGVLGTNYFVDILEATTLAMSRSFEFPGAYVPGMRFSQDSARLVLDPATRASALEYDLNNGQLTELTREKGWDQRLTPNGRYLIRLLNSEPDLEIMAAIQMPAEVMALAWSPDSRFIVSGYNYPFQIDLWRVEDTQHIHTFKGLMRSPSIRLQFWNRIIRAEVGRFKPSRHRGTWMISAQFSADGSTLAMSTRDDGIHLLRMAR
jgi:eukaryotic-like serine/threonine-protein kinase